MQFKPIAVNNPQRDSVYNQLKDAILDGTIKPGEKIRETYYAEVLCVSRTPVREAIRMLERDGLVIYTPQRGAIARTLPSESEMSEVYMIRGALQKLSAESIINNITDTQIQTMEDANNECIEALKTHNDDDFFKYLGVFNETLTESCALPLLIKLIKQVDLYNPQTAFASSKATKLREFAYDDDRKANSTKEHAEILNALRAGNVHELENAISMHSLNSKEAAMKGYRKFCAMFEGKGE